MIRVVKLTDPPKEAGEKHLITAKNRVIKCCLSFSKLNVIRSAIYTDRTCDSFRITHHVCQASTRRFKGFLFPGAITMTTPIAMQYFGRHGAIFMRALVG